MANLNESDIRELIRTMIEQEMDQFDIEDEEKDKCDIGECGTPCEKCEKNETCDKRKDEELDEVSSVTAMGGQDGYQTPYAFAKSLKDRTREISQQLGYKLVNDPEDRDWEDLANARKESLVYRKKFAEMKVRSGLNEEITIELYQEVTQSDKQDFGNFGGKRPFTGGGDKLEEGIINEAKADKKGMMKKLDSYIKKLNLARRRNESWGLAELSDLTYFLNEIKSYMGSTNESVNEARKSYSIVAIKNNKVVDQFHTTDHKEIDDVISVMKKDNKGAKISVEDSSGQVIKVVKEGRRGAYQNYRDDDTMNNKQKIGVAIRDVRNQLESIEKTIDLNLRLKQETGIDSQKYWKNTHRALNKINEKMTRIINKIRRF